MGSGGAAWPKEVCGLCEWATAAGWAAGRDSEVWRVVVWRYLE